VDGQAIVDQHLPDLEPPWRSVAERLVEVILEALPEAQHARKWGQLTFTQDGDWHHWICAISPTRKVIKLVLHKGAMLDDPDSVLEGSARYTRSIAFRAPDEIDASVVVPILRQAAQRRTEMLPRDPG
jgi:hypothetical protein